MAATPDSGFLVLADLTGDTAYLSRSELEHALATLIGRHLPIIEALEARP